MEFVRPVFMLLALLVMTALLCVASSFVATLDPIYSLPFFLSGVLGVIIAVDTMATW